MNKEDISKKFLPTAEQMKEFAKHFSKDEWARLCEHQNFLNNVTENLVEAAKIAAHILIKK